jgi:hypothetical protein
MAKLDLSNIIRVTLLAALTGLANVNTSALALFTKDVPINPGYGSYGVYLDAPDVAADFGSSSSTYMLAEQAFSQSPNMLSGNGYLIVIPRQAAASAQPATIIGSAPVDLTKLTATNYELHAAVDGASAADISIGAINSSSISAAQTSLNSTAITSAGLTFVVTGPVTAASITLKTLATGASPTAEIAVGTATTGTDIAPGLNIAGASASGAALGTERVKDAILRTMGSVAYFGIILNDTESSTDLTELAAFVQTLDKILVVGSSSSSDITGIFTTLQGLGYTHTRCLFHSVSATDALYFAAAYAGRGFSIDFSGSNTAHSMNLKQLTGLDVDEGMTQALYQECQNAGVDCYPDFGLGVIQCSGANLFFDQIYTRLAFKVQLQIAGFNYLAQTTTKIPQTEDGMNGLKSAYRQICKKFVTNGVFAPGTWTSSQTFGDPETHISNIAQAGYYIYSDPISGQSESARTARIAPRIYIAGKDAGAINSSDVTVYIEA